MPIINITWWKCVKLWIKLKLRQRESKRLNIHDWIYAVCVCVCAYRLGKMATLQWKRWAEWHVYEKGELECREFSWFSCWKIIANFKFDLGCLWSDLHRRGKCHSIHGYIGWKTDLNIWIFDASDKILLWIYGIRLYLQPHIDCNFAWRTHTRAHTHKHTSKYAHTMGAAWISFCRRIIRFTRINTTAIYTHTIVNRTNPPFIRNSNKSYVFPEWKFYCITIANSTRCTDLILNGTSTNGT